MKELAGKTAIISGGAEGIGFGIAEVLGENGMNIVLTDINADGLAEAEQKLKQQNVPVISSPLDVVDKSQWEKVVQQAIAEFGKVHMLINNAGVGGEPRPIELDTQESWKWVVDVNLMGVVNGAHAVIPHVKQHGEGGWLINVASMAGFVSLPLAGAYSATKAAVVAMSECWHGELSNDNIHVSVLCPGFVKTRINQSQRNRHAQYESETSSGSEGEAKASPFLKGLAAKMQEVVEAGTPPKLIGQRVVEAIAAKELYIITHPNFKPAVEARFNGILSSFDRASQSELLSEINSQRIPDFG